MIRLFTGLPGTGKSLSAVAELVRLRNAEPHRPIFAHGIDGLREDLAQPCDPRRWEDLPDGSIVIVDEAQKVWPSRSPSSRTPPDVAALSEHRHRGFDFLLCTQSPGYLDHYVTGLVQEHTHMVRMWGGMKVKRYVWQECCKDVKSVTMRARAQCQKWRYPKECFDLYTSASIHTVKPKRPLRVYAIPALLLLAVVLAVYGMRGGALKGASARTAKAVSTVERGGGVTDRAKRSRWATPAEYVADHLPRIANQPWSAPIFDDQPVVAKPDLLCIEHEDPRNSGEMLCNCYTEQVTPYELHSLAECRTYARHGVYNPRREPFVVSNASEGGQLQRGGQGGDEKHARKASLPVSPSGDWQPAWRTRAYVQPEKTVNTARPLRSGF